MPSSSGSMHSSSSSSSGSSFWDAESGSDSEYNDAQDEYSEWRDCLRGMEAKYPRGGAGTTVAHIPTEKSDVVEPAQQRQGVMRSDEDLVARPKSDSPRPSSSMHSYPDDPPTYEVAIGKIPSKKQRPSPPTVIELSQTKNGAHLVLFQKLAEEVEKNPYWVIHSISQWLMDPESPEFWKPFGLSIRGLAHEQIERGKFAQKDYAEGLRRFHRLKHEQGEAAVERLKANVRFMEFRIVTLGGVVPTDRTKKHSRHVKR
ncbi:hypothetical protein FRC09_005718 [Ceratobasidium sp. 395]|nr:hypothetical protein FRC09_005718 [Ceratobasidium sp. 395]